MTVNEKLKNNRTPKSRTLSSKYVGSYHILKVLADRSAYHLDLLPELGNIHPTFHISFLKPYYSSNRSRRALSFPLEIQLDHKTLEEILRHRNEHEKTEYLVHYAGTDPTEDDWIHESQFEYNDVLLAYERSQV